VETWEKISDKTTLPEFAHWIDVLEARSWLSTPIPLDKVDPSDIAGDNIMGDVFTDNGDNADPPRHGIKHDLP
jgi:hypothetical protein